MNINKLMAGAAFVAVAFTVNAGLSGVKADEVKTKAKTTTVVETYTPGSYAEWDMNNDGYVDHDEMANTSYTKIDIDNDGIIDGTEWTSYTTYTIEKEPGDDSRTLAQFDLDGNGNINETEYQAYLDSQKVYESWDIDNDARITASEYETVTKKFETRPDGSHVTTTTTVKGKSTLGDVDAGSDADVVIEVK